MDGVGWGWMGDVGKRWCMGGRVLLPMGDAAGIWGREEAQHIARGGVCATRGSRADAVVVVRVLSFLERGRASIACERWSHEDAGKLSSLARALSPWV